MRSNSTCICSCCLSFCLCPFQSLRLPRYSYYVFSCKNHAVNSKQNPVLCSRPGTIIEFEANVTWTHHYPLELPEQPASLQDADPSTISKRTGKPGKCEQMLAQCNDFKTRLGEGQWSVRDLCPVTCKVQPWILIRSSRHAELPPLGTRVGPEHAHLMPKIMTDMSTPALVTKFRAHHYYIHGLEIGVTPNTRENFGLVRLGTDGCSNCRQGDFFPTSVDQLPHHITFDQVGVPG